MISIFQRNKKSITAMMLVFFAALLMISFGLDVRTGMRSGGDVALKVEGQKISHRTYFDRYNMMLEMYRRQFGASFANFKKYLNVEQRTIDSIVEEILQERFTDSLNLSVGTQQLEQHLTRIPYFQKVGLTQDTYKSFLQQQGMSPMQFEQIIRQQVVVGQIQGLFSDLAAPSAAELRTGYETENAKAAFDYIPFPTQVFASKVDVSDEAKLKEYFEVNAEKYRRPKSVRYAYVAFPPSEFAAKVTASDDDLKDLYERKTRELTEPRQVHLRQILLRRPKQEKSELEKMVGGGAADPEKPADVAALDKQKKDLIKSLKEKAEAGAVFADLAKESSEDMTTKENGGDLGWKAVNDIEKELRAAAARLEKGGVSDIVTTPEKYVLFFAEDVKESFVKPFETVREKLTEDFRANVAPEYARVEAENFLSAFREASAGKEQEVTLAKYAESKGRTAVTTEKLLTKAEDPPGIQGLTAKAISLLSGDANVLRAGDIDYVVSVLETKDSSVPELPEVKDKVVEDYRTKEATRLAKEAAEAALKKLREMGTKSDTSAGFASIAAQAGTEVKKTEPLTKIAQTSDELLASPDTKREAFGLTLDRPLPETVATGTNTFYVYRLRERTLPPPEEVEKGLAEYGTKEKEKVQSRMFAFVMETLKASSDIYVAPDLLQKSEDGGDFDL